MIEHRLRESLSLRLTSKIFVEPKGFHYREIGLDGVHRGLIDVVEWRGQYVNNAVE